MKEETFSTKIQRLRKIYRQSTLDSNESHGWWLKQWMKKSGESFQKKKKDDLLKLCIKLAIPKTYHNFYQKLKVHDNDQTEQDQTD